MLVVVCVVGVGVFAVDTTVFDVNLVIFIVVSVLIVICLASRDVSVVFDVFIVDTVVRSDGFVGFS